MGCRCGLPARGLYVTWMRTTSSDMGDTDGGCGVARGVECAVDGARCILNPQMPEPSDPVASSLTLECVSSELSMAWERPLENTLRSAVLVTLVSASERRDPSADTESSQRIPPATPLCSVQQHTRRTITLHQPTCNTVIRRYSRNAQLSVPFVC